jgi:hypothetical protein
MRENCGINGWKVHRRRCWQHQFGDVAHRQRRTWLKQPAAVVERRDHEIMQIGREDERDAEHGEEVSEGDALLALHRVEAGDEAEPQLLCDRGARDLQRRKREPRGQAENGGEDQFLNEEADKRRETSRDIDRIGRSSTTALPLGFVSKPPRGPCGCVVSPAGAVIWPGEVVASCTCACTVAFSSALKSSCLRSRPRQCGVSAFATFSAITFWRFSSQRIRLFSTENSGRSATDIEIPRQDRSPALCRQILPGLWLRGR